MRDEKLHADVARSTFRSQHVQNTPLSDHFWKLRRRKSARRCGAKRISKSKCTKHLVLGALLEVEISKKCTPLQREAHFEVKLCKKHIVRCTFGSSEVRADVARSTFRSQNVQNTLFGSLLEDEMLKSSQRCRTKHVSKSKCTKYFSLGAHLEVEMLKKCTPMWREAHYEVKMLKYLSLGLLLEVEMLKKRLPL
jgi:hypothetical protein